MKSSLTTSTSTLMRTQGANRAVLASRLSTAGNFVSRSVGLLGKSSLPEGEGLWIKRCNSIHTFFMRFPIDAVFVDEGLRVVSVYRELKPWRITRLHFKASSVFELPAGTLATDGLEVGDQLSVEDAKESTSGGANG